MSTESSMGRFTYEESQATILPNSGKYHTDVNYVICQIIYNQHSHHAYLHPVQAV